LKTGYLNVENQNSQVGCQQNEASIMRGQIWPFINGHLDHFAQGQVGWWDTDGNNIFDPVDASLQINAILSTTEVSNIYTFDIELEETPFPAPAQRSLLINKLQTVQYRIDDGPWLNTTSADGAFDSYREAVYFTTDPLSSGLHTLYLRTQDNFGKVNEQAATTFNTVDLAANSFDTHFALQSSVTDMTPDQSYHFTGMTTHLAAHTISNVQYRVNGSNWEAAQAVDGRFNDTQESFTFTVKASDFSSAKYLIEVRGMDDQGYVESSPTKQTFWLQVPETTVSIYLPIIRTTR
jgi:hypothetical protein